MADAQDNPDNYEKHKFYGVGSEGLNVLTAYENQRKEERSRGCKGATNFEDSQAQIPDEIAATI